MEASAYKPISLHRNAGFFREAVRFTSNATGFNPALIEKDYFCSVLLQYLSRFKPANAVFRGATCLSKVYTDFYRLSEDLDFTISVPLDIPRTERSKKISPFKEALRKLPGILPCFSLSGKLQGHAESRQYIAHVGYSSLITSQPASIKIEIALREPLLLKARPGPVRTLLINPLTKRTTVPEFSVPCIALNEAYAEKVRAALTRRFPAIRDFFDLDYAATKLGVSFKGQGLRKLIEEKLQVPGNEPIDVSPERKEALRKQVYTQLRAVLRERDFEKFDLDRIFSLIVELSKSFAERASRSDEI